MRSICFIAQFPPPIHGLSKAVETLYESHLDKIYYFQKIDITNNKAILKNIWNLLFTKVDLFYFTISQTKGGNWRDLLIFKILQLKHKKCLIHLHGGYYRNLIENDCGSLQRVLNYKALKVVNGCIVLGKSLVPIFQDMICDQKIFIVPNCVDDQYMLNEVDLNDKMLDLMSQKILHILYLSNFIEKKGYKEVLQLVLEAKKENRKQLHFHFAGKFFSVTDKEYFIQFIVENRLEDYVTYHGIVSGKAKIDLLSICNLFILLTRYPNEGQPISILEAMGNAMAVITTNHAGIPDIVEDKVNGLMVDKQNIDLRQIYDYILTCLDDRKLLKQLAEKNYQVAVSAYTESRYIDNMYNVFNAILAQ